MSNLLDWSDLEIALAIAEAGSLSGAAIALGKQQPTISTRLNQLEGRLGVKLFIRSRSGTKLTDIGQEVIDKAKIMQITALEIERTTQGKNSLKEGIVTFHCTDGLAAYWVAPKLADFISTHPNINLEIDTGENPPSVNSNQADLMLQFDNAKEMDAIAVPVGWLHYIPFTTKKYLHKYGTPADVYDALKLNHLKLRNAQHRRESWDPSIISMDELITYSMTTNNSSVYFEALRAGAGIAFLPSMFATIDSNIVYIDFGISVKLQFWIVYNRGLRKIAKNKAVLKWLKSIFSPSKHPFFRQEFICPTEFSAVEVIRPTEQQMKSK